MSSNLTALWLLYRYTGSFQVFMEEKFVHICIAWLMHNLVQQSIILLIAHFQLDITKGGQYCQLITNIYILYISSWSVVSITHSEPQGLRPDRVDVWYTWSLSALPHLGLLIKSRGRGQVSECRKSAHDRCVMATENIDDYRWQYRLSSIKYTVYAENLILRCWRDWVGKKNKNWGSFIIIFSEHAMLK